MEFFSESGRGESEVTLPEGLLGKPLLVEAWGGLLSKTFHIQGDQEGGGIFDRKDLGSSGWGRNRSHIIVPALYSSLQVSGDVIRKPGKWNLLIGELSTAPKLDGEISGEASRVFSYHGGEVDASVDFGGHGCLAMYNFDGSRRRELVKRNSKFHGVVSIPGPGLIAIQSGVGGRHWGSLPPWRISLG
ncbi:hypothetical protein [Streptomyces prunicolor]|uniref:hypothetical protein n=1 Tax=Streptomyces prunicolor TaxID=67348 RepID=UPI0034252BE3